MSGETDVKGGRGGAIARRLLLPALAIALLAAASAPAASLAASPTGLSPRLLAVTSPAVRGLGPQRQSRSVGLAPSGAGSLLRHGRRLIVDVHFAPGAAASTDALRQAGAQIVAVGSRYGIVTVAALPAELRQVAAVPGVAAVSEEVTPFSKAVCPSGAILSEGDTQLEAGTARADFGVDGSGVTVGILSDSFDQWREAPVHAAGDVATGDLPGTANPCGQPRPVDVLTPYIPGAAAAEGGEPENEEEGEPADEGRAMAQIVHDLAPGADIDFASAHNGEYAFANAIRALHAAGAQVIGDDAGYFDEPFFQDGPVAVAVNEVTAAGANYFSAAGNDNMFSEGGEGKDEIASWEAPAFRPIKCPVGIPSYEKTCMDFNPKAGGGKNEDPTFGITVEKEEPLFVDLQWAQPWGGVTTDLDAFLLNKKGEIVETAFNEANTEPGRQEPYEFIPWESHVAEGEPEEEVQLVIARCDAECGVKRAELAEDENGVKILAGTKGGDDGTPRLKIGLFENGGGVAETEFPKSSGGDVVGPTVFGHAGSAAAIGVGAIKYTTKSEPEFYSSRGPVTHYFGPVAGSAPAAPIAAQVIPKPNVTATDCGKTTYFYGLRADGFYRFCGTSAATPHAAAIAALIRSANPTATNVQVRQAMEGTAQPIGLFGHEAIGAGLLDANRAVAALALPPLVTITKAPALLSRERQPQIGFSANRPVTFACALDGSAPAPCAGSYTPAKPLADGEHTFVVSATDLAGRTGSASAKFAIDTKGPHARIAKHPPKVIRTRRRTAKVGFRFVSSEPTSSFTCKIDRSKLHRCPPKFSHRFRRGVHLVSVRATDIVGNTGEPVRFKFRVKRIR